MVQLEQLPAYHPRRFPIRQTERGTERMSRKEIYIAGPMRGKPEFNFPAFFEADWRLQSEGWYVHNPAQFDIERGLNVIGAKGEMGEIPEFCIKKAMAENCKSICESDAIYLLKGWKDSKGSQCEFILAQLIGLEVIEQ
jgi:hypothetical protein